ncbi:MAG: AMP-binding protein, partial [Caulobacteraceae bacterium]
AMHVGVPLASITPAYSLISTDYAKLKHVLGLLTPGLIYADDGAAFAKALAAAAPEAAELVVRQNPPEGRPTTLFETLAATEATDAVEAAAARVGPDTVARIMFTSGSTGFPKGVTYTQRILTSNQQMFNDVMPGMEDTPPLLIDWLPWHHTSGGIQILGMILYNGGSLYIDDGRPMPGAIDATIANLREIAPTTYFTVPRGYVEMIRHLRAEPAFRDHFFSRVAMLYYSGAPLPDRVIHDLDELSIAAYGVKIPMISGYGATETGPLCLCANWLTDKSGLAGLPVPGVELKLAPYGDKYEARLKGPGVMPGYWRQDELTRAAFDEEGFYKLGDALAFVDPDDPTQGLTFNGRIAEDFKLTTGTWVNAAILRAQMIEAASPCVAEVVLAGEGRAELAALIFPNLFELCRLADLPDDADRAAVLGDPRVRGLFQEVLDRLARKATGSSQRIVRAALMVEPPSGPAGELTDKGSINQKAVLANRKAIVEALYTDDPPEWVLVAR